MPAGVFLLSKLAYLRLDRNHLTVLPAEVINKAPLNRGTAAKPLLLCLSLESVFTPIPLVVVNYTHAHKFNARSKAHMHIYLRTRICFAQMHTHLHVQCMTHTHACVLYKEL